MVCSCFSIWFQTHLDLDAGSIMPTAARPNWYFRRLRVLARKFRGARTMGWREKKRGRTLLRPHFEQHTKFFVGVTTSNKDSITDLPPLACHQLWLQAVGLVPSGKAA
jgi:hypothetical protein